MLNKQQQLFMAHQALGKAVEACCIASQLVLHGQDASQQHELAARLQAEADAEWDKYEQLASKSMH